MKKIQKINKEIVPIELRKKCPFYQRILTTDTCNKSGGLGSGRMTRCNGKCL